MKRALVVLTVLALFLAAAGYGVYRYLHSSQVAEQVTSRIEQMYGGSVRVGQVNVGLSESSLDDFTLYEKDGENSTPWLTVRSIRTDVSLWDLVRGSALPGHVTLEAPVIVLRFNRAGELLTRFPASRSAVSAELSETAKLPEAEVENGTVVFRKEGQPDLVAKDVQARLRHEDGKLVLRGTAHSAALGKLILAGRYDPDAHTAEATLSTENAVSVDQSLLARLPFIPASVWDVIAIQRGVTSAELNARFDLHTRALHYRLDLAPRATDLRIVALDLSVHDASGSLVVEDGVIHLRDARGKAFGGTLRTDANLDFRGAVARLHFPTIAVANVDVSKLPASWHFPPQVRGRLAGTAHLNVDLIPGHVTPLATARLVGHFADSATGTFWSPLLALAAQPTETQVRVRGEGDGIITGARVGDFSAEPIKLHWNGSRGFQLDEVRKSAAATQVAPLGLALVVGATQPATEANEPTVLRYPLWAIDRLVGGVRDLSEGIADTLGTIAQMIPKRFESADAKPSAPPSYLTITLKLNDVDVGELVKKAGVKLPVAVAGKVSFQVKASLPINRPGDLRAYKAHGTAQAKPLAIDTLRFERVTAAIDLADGVLALTSLQGQFASTPEGASQGTLTGDARVLIAPQLGTLYANLTLDRIPLAQVVGVTGVPVTGTFSGKVAARVPADKAKSPTAWLAGGTLTSAHVSAYGLALQDTTTNLFLKDGVLLLTKFQGRVAGAPISGNAKLTMSGAFPYTAELTLRDGNVASLMRLSPQVRPPRPVAGSLSTTANLKGTLAPFTLGAAGDALAASLALDTFRVESAKFHWDYDGERLTLDHFATRLYGGAAAGKAVLPLTPKSAGHVELHLSHIDARQLAKDLPIPFKLDGHFDGAVKGTLPPAAGPKGRTATLDVDLKAPKLRVQNIPTEKLHARIEYLKGTLDYKLEGHTLGGTFELEGQVPSASEPAPKPAPKEGKLTVRSVSLARLAAALNVKAPLGGRATLEMTFTHLAEGPLEGKGRLRVIDLSWQDRTLIPNLLADLTIVKGVVRLRELTGSLASGTFRAQLVYNLHNPERSWFNLTLDNVESSVLLAPWLGDSIKGPVQARVRGSLGSEWRGSADIELLRGRVFGLDVSRWRLPLSWAYAPAQARGRIEVYETGAQVSRGRITGRLTLAWDYTARVEGHIRFYRVDVQDLLREMAGAAQLGGGPMSGRFDFSGGEVRSLDDLRGTFEASFAQSQPLPVPVFRQLTPYLGVGSTTTFQRGELRANLDRGVWRIRRLSLEGGALSLFIDGTMTLAGRLNLAAVAQTGNVGLPTQRLRLLGLRIPIAGPLPLTVVMEASNLLSNRVIYFTIGGTIRHPSVRVRPLPILTQEAVRYFLYRAVLPAGGL